jgi:hypothetical protein
VLAENLQLLGKIEKRSPEVDAVAETILVTGIKLILKNSGCASEEAGMTHQFKSGLHDESQCHV